MKKFSLVTIIALIALIFSCGCHTQLRNHYAKNGVAKRLTLKYALAEVGAKSQGIKMHGIVSCVEHAKYGDHHTLYKRAAYSKAARWELLRRGRKSWKDVHTVDIENNNYRVKFRDGKMLEARVLPKSLFDSFLGEKFSCWRVSFNVYLKK